MKSISLISVYNNKEKLQEMVDSANNQIFVDIDFVLIDNTDYKFKSASSALNYGVKQAKGDVLVFVHQDIIFLDNHQLNDIYDFAVNNKNTIFGAAGVRNRDDDINGTILSSIYEGCPKTKYNTLKKAEICFTLDECIIACYKDCMNTLSFDETICDGWHLYGADLCLQASLVNDMNVMVVPMNLWHKSHGCADKNYYIVQNRLAKKYADKYSVINTTNGYIYTNPLKRFLLNIYRKVRYRI